MKLRQDILCHIMVNQALRHDRIEELDFRVHASGYPGVDDCICAKNLYHQFRRYGGIHLTYAAVSRDHVDFPNRSLVKFQSCLFRDPPDLHSL